MTKPTGKKRFDAGKNGREIKARLISKAFWPKYRETNSRWRKMAPKSRVIRFLGSARLVTKGTVPIVQSHNSSEGDNNSHALTEIQNKLA